MRHSLLSYRHIIVKLSSLLTRKYFWTSDRSAPLAHLIYTKKTRFIFNYISAWLISFLERTRIFLTVAVVFFPFVLEKGSRRRRFLRTPAERNSPFLSFRSRWSPIFSLRPSWFISGSRVRRSRVLTRTCVWNSPREWLHREKEIKNKSGSSFDWLASLCRRNNDWFGFPNIPYLSIITSNMNYSIKILFLTIFIIFHRNFHLNI